MYNPSRERKQLNNLTNLTDMRLLLTGKTGQLGWELRQQLEYDYEVIAIGREDADFLDAGYLKSAVRQLPKLDLIVNAAGYTDIDQAEEEPFVAEAINSDAVAILAEEADFRGIPLIHFSTEHVFSGWRRTWEYRENEHAVPGSMYGRTKLDGEQRVRNMLEKHLIFRLSGLYGLRRKNFFTEILARNRKCIVPHVVDDQIISPNWVPLVAEAIANAIQQLFGGEDIPWGTYHLSGSGFTTPYEFARLICKRVNELYGDKMPLPVPILSRASNTKARRPKFSVLNSKRFNDTFQFRLPNWQEQFLMFFDRLTLDQTGQ
jgi:dTDP-4-dehydrorhamnose reductase